ncbi:MAG TPA: signal recognition particle-docking protein FtsY [Kofleriaceae bacterium]|nr:signal recognition particle-docking protein FtsY [Kofleriaceae bacterium]
MEQELLQLAIALAVIALIIFVLRRASLKSRARAPSGVQDRLGLRPEEERPRERIRRPRPGQEAEPAAAPKPKRPAPKDEDDDEDEDDEDEDEDEADEREEAEEREAADEREEPREAVDAEARDAYKAGLAKTRGGFVAKLGKLFGRKKIDAQTLDELEEALFTADIGPRAADRIFQSVKSGLSKSELEKPDKIWAQIRKTSKEILSVDAPPADTTKQPFVLLVLGVNGVGKTTTIGKLADRWTREGKKVLLAAGDTFRAAATEQLEEWGKRAGVPVVKGKAGGDPSSVIFDAIKRGVDEQLDIVICDTAGRLHSNAGLMDELKKVRRVCDRAMPGAPHEVWMVLDATTGQNAISQAKAFKADMEISGIVLTKLDGSAKGGVILGICDELKVPVRYVGVGEKIGDLRPFDPVAFVDALYADANTSEAA